jgi:Protein related to penicillin acylase
LLENWDGDFTADSPAATIYYFWLLNYLNDTFLPWFEYYNITPADGLGYFSLFLGPDAIYHGPLILDLANWTNNYPNIQWFNNPLTGQRRNATMVMLLAFNQTITELTHELGPNPSTWYWGRVHKRILTNFFGINPLSVGPFPAPGDGNTINAAYGLLSNEGPSWRMVIDMAEPLSAVGVYPGGVSEYSLSPLYNDTTAYWLNGQYYTLIPPGLPQYFYYLYTPKRNPTGSFVMRLSERTWFWVLFVINLVISLILSITGYWLLITVLGIVIGYLLNARRALNVFAATGVPALIAVLIAILMNPYALDNGEITAAIIGLPYNVTGAVILLIVTVLIAMAVGGLGGLVGHYVRKLVTK